MCEHTSNALVYTFTKLHDRRIPNVGIGVRVGPVVFKLYATGKISIVLYSVSRLFHDKYRGRNFQYRPTLAASNLFHVKDNKYSGIFMFISLVLYTELVLYIIFNLEDFIGVELAVRR